MVIMHHALLPFARSLILLCDLMSTIRSIKNKVRTSLLKRILKCSMTLSSFKAGIQQVPYSSSEADKFTDETFVCSVYNAIAVKMLNMIL